MATKKKNNDNNTNNQTTNSVKPSLPSGTATVKRPSMFELGRTGNTKEK